MAVKFLSSEWMHAVEDALNRHEPFRRAAGSRSALVQQVVTRPEGETRYWFALENGEARLGLGDRPDPDATVSQDYETAAAVSRNELNPVTAFMMGRLRISGDLPKLMQLQGALGEMPAAIRTVEVEY